MTLRQRIVMADCPTRIDFTGGFTDVLPFRHDHRVIHVNAAIELRTRVVLHTREDSAIHIRTRNAEVVYPTTDAFFVSSDFHLLKDVLQSAGIHTGLTVSIISRAPIGAGLGSSGALSVTLAAGLAALIGGKNLQKDPAACAVRAAALESSCRIIGGWQDQFAATHGNVHRFDFWRDEWSVHQIRFSAVELKKLEDHLLIAYPGGKRESSDIVADVMAAYTRRDVTITAALARLNQLAPPIETALRILDMNSLARLLAMVRETQRMLHPRLIDRRSAHTISELEHAGIEGTKLLGGGGTGGCILVACETVTQRLNAQRLLRRRAYRLLPVKIASHGLCIKVKSV